MLLWKHPDHGFQGLFNGQILEFFEILRAIITFYTKTLLGINLSL